MADTDDSYDLTDLDDFIERLRFGCKLVTEIVSRAASRLARCLSFIGISINRYLGNRFFSLIGRMLLSAAVGDSPCGMRGFERRAILALNLRASGMEFAREMVASLATAKVPTTLSPDGRGRNHF